MSPVMCETARSKVRDEFDAFSWESRWYESPQILINPQRLTDSPTSTRQKLHSPFLLETIKGEYDPSVRHFQGLFEAQTLRWSPRHRAETPRELIEAIQKQSEDRRAREVRQLQTRIASLTRELASLKQSKTTYDLGEVVAVHGLRIPAHLTNVIAAMEESRQLLELDEDWDGNGTPGFSEQTWARTAGVLIAFTSDLAANHGVFAEDIEILPGADGGLDIDVRSGDRQLLFAVSSDPRKEVRFYGDDGNRGNQIKATLDPAKMPDWLSIWMAE